MLEIASDAIWKKIANNEQERICVIYITHGLILGNDVTDYIWLVGLDERSIGPTL